MDFDMFLAALRNIVRSEHSDPKRKFKPVIIGRTIRLYRALNDQAYSPINAVCLAQTGQVIPTSRWERAADEIGLSLDGEAEVIQFAANYEEGHDPVVRKSLLDTLELSEYI